MVSLTHDVSIFMSLYSLARVAEVLKWELEDYISSIMELEFNTQVDDASLPEVV